MLQAFKANLKNNQLEWLDEQPTYSFDKPKPVYVIFIEESQVQNIEETEDYKFNEVTLAALKEIETGSGKVFENVEELFKNLEE